MVPTNIDLVLIQRAGDVFPSKELIHCLVLPLTCTQCESGALGSWTQLETPLSGHRNISRVIAWGWGWLLWSACHKHHTPHTHTQTEAEKQSLTSCCTPTSDRQLQAMRSCVSQVLFS